MELCEFIHKEQITLIDLPATERLELLRPLFDRLVISAIEGGKLSSDASVHSAIWQTLREREVALPTGVGSGVAIPHCSTEYVDEVVGLLVRLAQGVEYEASDGIPVRIVVLLLLPRNSVATHLRTMASVARFFSTSARREAFLTAVDEQEVLELLASARN